VYVYGRIILTHGYDLPQLLLGLVVCALGLV